MKLNSKTAISTSKVLLAPYESHHVAKYHGWMSDPAMREATASEPLTLEEEYANQVSWRRAHDKLTFIVCKPLEYSWDVEFIRMNTFDKWERMVGDVNFFLHPYDGPEEDEPQSKTWVTGEIDIMIAESDLQRTGMGIAAVKAVLVYVQVQMGFLLEEYVTAAPKEEGKSAAALRSLMVKIKQSNKASMGLFEKLGFRVDGGVNYFGEIKMVMDIAELQTQPWWEKALADWIQIPYGGMADERKFQS